MERKKISLEDSYWMPGWFRVSHQFFYYVIAQPLFAAWLFVANSIWVLNHRLIRGGKHGILVSNHSLIMDPAIADLAIWPRRSAFSIKEQLMTGRPILNLFLRSLGGYTLHYRRLGELAGAVSKYLDEYGFAHFFPEGDEGWGFQNQKLNRFSSGAFYFAIKLGVPVMPVVIVHFTRRIFGIDISFLPRRVLVVHLDPVDPTSYTESGERSNKAAATMAEDVHTLMQDCINDFHSRRDRRNPKRG
jgi:1-acyl-sn-glycerol-3-phosphate acyltransferase